MKRSVTWEKWQNIFIPSETDEEENSFVTTQIPFIQTPYGGISYKIFAPEKNNLNWWVGHSNFDLGEIECNIIDDTQGVEILDIFSAYRFRVCIGRNFDDMKVKRNIEIRLDCKKVKKLNKAIRKLKLDLEDEGKMWLIYSMPNGKNEHFSTEDHSEFEGKLNQYSQAERHLGGQLIFGVS